MAEYQRDIGGTNVPSQTISVKQKPTGGEGVLAEVLTQFGASAVKGFATEKMAQGVRQATGMSVSEDEANKNVADFNSAMEDSDYAAHVTPEGYRKRANEYLGKINSDAKTLDKLVTSGRISSLQGEAFARRNVSAAMANPFWAALGGDIQKAAGPLAGGSDGVSMSAFATPELRDLYAKAEVDMKVQKDFREAVQKIVINTGWDEETAVKHITARARFEEKQKTEAVTLPEIINNHVSKDYYDLTEQMNSRIDPVTNTIGAQGYAEMRALASQKFSQAQAAINASGLSEKDKAARIAAAKMQYDGIAEMAKAFSNTEVTKTINEQNKEQAVLTGSAMDPARFVLAQSGQQELLKYLNYMDRDEVSNQLTRMNGIGRDDIVSRLDAVNSIGVLFAKQPGAFSPNAIASTAFGAPGVVQDIDTAAQENPKFFQQVAQQTNRYPVQTLTSLRSGPVLLAASKGDENAQKTTAATINAIVAGIKADMALFPDAGGPSVKIEGDIGDTYQPPVARIFVPDSMPDKQETLDGLYKVIKQAPWTWPEGTTTAEEAYNIIVKQGLPQFTEQEMAKSLHGEEAVKAVEAKEGKLSSTERQIAMDEGYNPGDYKDTKGVTTSGVGQTGEFRGKSFKETVKTHKDRLDKVLPEIGTYPKEVQDVLYSSAYQGALTGSPKALKLMNEGKFKEAALEFLSHEDYDSGAPGVKDRMYRTAMAIKKLAETNKVDE